MGRRDRRFSIVGGKAVRKGVGVATFIGRRVMGRACLTISRFSPRYRRQ